MWRLTFTQVTFCNKLDQLKTFGRFVLVLQSCVCWPPPPPRKQHHTRHLAPCPHHDHLTPHPPAHLRRERTRPVQDQRRQQVSGGGLKGLGFRVWGLGFRVWGLGFRVECEFQCCGAGLRWRSTGASSAASTGEGVGGTVGV